MNQFEQLDQLTKEHGGMIQTFQVLEAGISKTVFYAYVKEKGQKLTNADAVCGLVPCRKNTSTIFGGTSVVITTSRQLKDLIRNLSKKSLRMRKF